MTARFQKSQARQARDQQGSKGRKARAIVLGPKALASVRAGLGGIPRGRWAKIEKAVAVGLAKIEKAGLAKTGGLLNEPGQASVMLGAVLRALAQKDGAAITARAARAPMSAIDAAIANQSRLRPVSLVKKK